MPAPLLDAWSRDALDAVTVCSSEGLANFLAMMGAAGQAHLARTPVFVPHARIAAAARALGLKTVLETGPADEGIVAGLGPFLQSVRVMSDVQIECIGHRNHRARGPGGAPALAARGAARAGGRRAADRRAGLVGPAPADRAVREELAQRLRAADTEAREARAAAREAQEGTRDAQARIGALDASVAESQSQQVALEAMYQESRAAATSGCWPKSSRCWPSPRSSCSLPATCRRRCSRCRPPTGASRASDRPQFIPLRKVLARDIERLKLAPNLDVPGMTLRLDQVIAAVDAMPLLVEGRPGPVTAPAEPEDAPGWWARTGSVIWAELRGLVRVQRLDAQDQSLLAPEQAYFLRENLKLRLLHARLALLQRNEPAFRVGPARGERAARPLFRHPPEAGRRCVGDARAAAGRGGERRPAVHQREPGRRAQLQAAARQRPGAVSGAAR